MTLSYLQKILLVVKNFDVSKRLMGFLWDGYLQEIGWINSFQQQKPVDKDNQPLPWVTYSFIDFITPRLHNTMTIVEFGSGNSTLFYSQRVKKVYAVEHDQDWYRQISTSMPENVKIGFVELHEDGDYARFAASIKEPLDMIIVDGRDRVNCIKQSVAFLSIEGIMVLDDAERSEYAEGINFMMARGFRKLDFWGIAPGVFYKKCTSLFYLENNCVGI